MKCPTCLKELSKKKLDSFDVAMCDSCRGIWVDSFTFEEIKHAELPFADLLKVRIWDDMKKHKERVYWIGKENMSDEELILSHIAHRILSGFYNSYNGSYGSSVILDMMNKQTNGDSEFTI